MGVTEFFHIIQVTKQTGLLKLTILEAKTMTIDIGILVTVIIDRAVLQVSCLLEHCEVFVS